MEQALSGTAPMALWLGLLSASSLLVGAGLSILLVPPRWVVAAIMAFGAGALISALAFELVEEAFQKAGFIPLAIGALSGGAVFVGLNSLLDQHGGFLRKPATTARFLRERKQKVAASVLERLSRVELLRALPPEEMQALIPHVEERRYPAGSHIFAQGEVGDALYLIEEGQVDIVAAPAGGGEVLLARLGPGDAFGEMALLTGEPRSATAMAATPVQAWQVPKEEFQRLLEVSPRLAVAASQLLARRLGATSTRRAEAEEEARRWHQAALRSIEPAALAPTPMEARAAARAHGGDGAAVAIWLGTLLDGIPESAIIGVSLLHADAVSASLIAGIFLSNLPEAMSSAVGMRRSGYGVGRIVGMWGFLVLLSGLVAFAANLSLVGAPLYLIAAFEGVGAGALLAMVAQTMIPEAYEQGGPVVGMATILGFLAAFFVRSLGGG